MKKVTSVLLICILVFSCTTAIFADNSDDYDYLAYVMSMERFVTVKDGTSLEFDSAAALVAGYDRNVVENIENHIACMNRIIEDYGGILGDDYSVTLVIENIRGGVTQVVQYWYGLTKVYLNSSDTQDFIDAMISFYDGISRLYDAINLLVPKINLWPYANLWDLYTNMYVSQIQAFASGGNGIIMNLYNDTNYNQTIIYYEAQ